MANHYSPRNRVITLLFAVVWLFPMLTMAHPYNTSRPIPSSNAPVVGQAFVAYDCNQPGNLLTNCGFEAGDFTGWVANDLADAFYPLSVVGPGVSPGFGFFTSAPTEGGFVAVNGFDGAGPGTIELGQDVMNLPAGFIIELQFDYRAAWDMTFGATQDRQFEVHVEPAGGGAPLATFPVLTAPAPTTMADTGDDTGQIDLSAFSGQSVRINFVWNIPELYTGPGFFQLDNVELRATVPIRVPTLPQWGVVLLVILFLGVAVSSIRRSSS